MQGVNIPFGSLVKATWLDSTALAGWVSMTRQKYNVTTIDTVGYVVRAHVEEAALTLSTSIANGLDVRQVIDPISIPWVSITKLEVLEDPTDRSIE